VDINVFHVCNAHAHEGLLRETAKQQGVKLTGTLVTCSGCVQAKGRRASIPTTTSSRKALPLQRVFVDLAGPRKIASAGGALYLILFKDDATRMGWLYPLKSKSAADVTAATRKFLADVGGAVECFRTDNGTEFVNALFANLCANEKIRHEHTGVDGPKHNGVVERGLGLIQEGGMAACLEAPRLFPGQLPNLDRYWVEAAIYMNDCLNTTATSANAHFKSPHEAFFGTLPPPNTLAFMQPGFHRIHRTHKSDPKAERCFYLNRGRHHPRDCVKVVTTCRRTSNSRDVTWEVERKPFIEAAPQVRKDSVAEPWEADLHIRYLPPELATVSPGIPPMMSPAPPAVPPTPAMTPAPTEVPPPPTPTPGVPPPPPGVTSPSSPPGAENHHVEDDEGPRDNELFQLGRTRARTRAMTKAPLQVGMPPVMTPAPPEMPPTPGVMSPSSPPGAENPQIEDDEGPPDNELLQPGRTRARTRAYHQASTGTSQPADHALFNQRPPNQPAPALPTCDAGQLSEPATYQEAMLSQYHANWSHAMETEIAGLEGAGTFGDA